MKNKPKVDNKWVEEKKKEFYQIFVGLDADHREAVLQPDEAWEWFAELITQTQQDTLERIVKVIKRHRPVFFKDDLKSLMSVDEAMMVREVLRIEILEELGIDCTKQRQIIKNKMEE